MVSQEILSIFNSVQKNEDISDNLTDLVKLTENKNNLKIIIETLDRIFLIIYKEFESGLNAFTHIKEFLKAYVERILKIKKEQIPENLINHFCRFFCQEPKKKNLKSVSMYFLSIFVSPYEKYSKFYHPDTIEEVKDTIVNALKSKYVNYQDSTIKLLKKVPFLQKERVIKIKLEELLFSSTVQIKKGILNLFDISQPDKLEILLEMCDDESSEVRHFVYDKLYKLSDLTIMNKKMKVKLFFIGLSETENKNKILVKNLLKKLLKQLGIIQSHREIRSEIKSPKVNNSMMEIEDESYNINKINDEEEENPVTCEEKLVHMTSPLKQQKQNNFDLKNPSLLFEELEVIDNYNHPKYSYTFELITKELINIVDEENLIKHLKSILDDLSSNYKMNSSYLSTNLLTTQVNNMNLNNDIENIEESTVKPRNKNTNPHINVLYNLMFLQLCTKYATNNERSNKHSKYDSHKSKLIKDFIEEYLPTTQSISDNIYYFYKEEPNVLVLHQLFLLLENCGDFSNDNYNRSLNTILNKMLLDMKLERIDINNIRHNYKLSQLSPLEFNNLENRLQNNNLSNAFMGHKDDKLIGTDIAKGSNKIENNIFIDSEGSLKLNILLENALLPSDRKIFSSLSDLIDNILTLMMRIYGNGNDFLRTLTTLMSELNENLEEDNDPDTTNLNIAANLNVSFYKRKRDELTLKIQEKLAEIQDLDVLLKRKKVIREKIEKKIQENTILISEWDLNIEEIKKEEINTNLRILKIAEFLIKNCKMNHQRKHIII